MFGKTVSNSGTVADVALEDALLVAVGGDAKLNPPAVGAAPPVAVGAGAVVLGAGVDAEASPAAGAAVNAVVGSEAFPPKLNTPAAGAAVVGCAAVRGVCEAPKVVPAADAPNVKPPPVDDPEAADAAADPPLASLLVAGVGAGAPKLNAIAVDDETPSTFVGRRATVVYVNRQTVPVGPEIVCNVF